MYGVSDQFFEAVRKGPIIETYAEVIRNGEVCFTVPVLDGNVTEDTTAAVRRRCSLTLSGDANPAVIPGMAYNRASCSTWPTGNMVRLWQVMKYNGAYPDEPVPLGTFRIQKPVVNDDGDVINVSFDGYDMSRAIARSRLIEYYTITGGTPASDAVRDLLLHQVPWLNDEDLVFTETDGSEGFYYYVPRAVLGPTDDPWKVATDIAQVCGFELFINRLNRVVFRPIPNPMFDDPVASYEEGNTDTVLSIERSLDDEKSYSGVIVTGESSDLDVPIRSEAWDTNQRSATYYDPSRPAESEFGPVPYFITSEFVATQAQADAAAAANLPKHVGILENVSFEALNNWAHDAHDVIRIDRDRVSVDGDYIILSLDIGLGPEGTMAATTRGRQLV